MILLNKSELRALHLQVYVLSSAICLATVERTPMSCVLYITRTLHWPPLMNTNYINWFLIESLEARFLPSFIVAISQNCKSLRYKF